MSKCELGHRLEYTSHSIIMNATEPALCWQNVSTIFIVMTLLNYINKSIMNVLISLVK